jgi:hypothetical protein
MINRVFAVCIAAGLGLATLPIEVSAKGLGGHNSHAARLHHQHRTFGYGYYGGLYGYYGGLVAADYANGIDPVVDVSTTQSLGPLIPASFASSCHHSVEIKTVPSEEGGTREITIRRC